MLVYRITRKRYEDKVLSGEGGRKVASRWNFKGDPIVYTSSTRSLALLEMLVHMDMEDMRMMDLIICEINIPESLTMHTLSGSALPENWNQTPFSNGTQKYWREFTSTDKTAVLRVPSVIIPQEWNYLIDPLHKDVKRIKVRTCNPLRIDQRF